MLWAQCIYGITYKGNVGLLCSFEHEKYSSNSVDPWCLIIEYLNNNN